MDIVERIAQEVKPVYLNSPFYSQTAWLHVCRVAQYGKDFAAKIGANQGITELGCLLHDLGAAKYGRDNHHITGVSEAAVVLLKCGCQTEMIGPVLQCVFSHRGSQEIPLLTPEAKCVAAGDALDHFTNLQELWKAQLTGGNVLEMNAYSFLQRKLEKDWEKISPEIKTLLNGTYQKAQEELLKIVSERKNSKTRQRLG